MWFLTLSVLALVSALFQLSVHFAVRLFFPSLGKLPRYALGTLGMLLPPSLAMALAGEWYWLFAVWACALSSGLCVIGAQNFGDRLTEHRDRMDKLERFEKVIVGKTQETD